MKLRMTLPLVAAIFVGLSGTAMAAPAERSKGAAKAAAQPSYMQGAGPMTPKQRGDATRDFVKRWGPYFQEVYNQPMERWAIKQAKVIAAADSNNLRAAMQSQTLEGAMMTMRGQATSDDEAINYLAKASGESGTLSLGDLAEDLVYTPLAPCRIFDTRSTGGIVASGGTRSYDTYPFGGNTDFAYQGGAAGTNCGVSPDAAAVVINIAAPLPVVGGFLTVFPYGTTRPLASALDYSAGELVNSEIIARSSNGLFDISVYVHGQSHIVGDVVGYFIRPEATALECQTPTIVSSVTPTGSRSFETVTCPAGFGVLGGGAGTGTNLNSYVNASYPFGNGWFSSVQNGSGTDKTYTHYAQCCRVPGR